MSVSPARKTAYQILLRMESDQSFAVDQLHTAEASALKDSDRRLATEIVMGVLRWRGELDFQIARASGRKVDGFDSEVLTILRLGVYQIRFLQRVPKRAVVNDAVELTKFACKRSAAGFVNAVLRKCEPPNDGTLGGTFEQLSSAAQASVMRAFPAWLLQRWAVSTAAREMGELGATRLAHASLASPNTTLRPVQADADLEDMRRELALEGVVTARCLYAINHGLRVESGHVRNSRAYREGRVVLQDEASQLVAELVAPQPGQRVLDLCAAPGMKAGQLAQSLTAGTLVASDRSAPRLRTLARLLPPSIPPAVRLSVVRLDAAQALPFGVKFDRILLDAPCSGTGTLTRNPEIKWRLRAEDITRLATLQATMLRNALPALANGGRLVYATCSLEPEENEGVVEKVMGEGPDFRRLNFSELAPRHPHLGPLFDSQGYFRTRPDQQAMDGFSAAIIVRRQDE